MTNAPTAIPAEGLADELEKVRPEVTYADHSYPAYSKRQMLEFATTALKPTVAEAVDDPHELFWMTLSDDGENIRRWSRSPFEGARLCRVALTKGPANG